jgi:hypothetical protein
MTITGDRRHDVQSTTREALLLKHGHPNVACSSRNERCLAGTNEHY